MKQLASVGLWLSGLASLGVAVYLTSVNALGFAIALLGGLVVSGFILCGLAAILDTLIEIRATLEGRPVSTTSRFAADPRDPSGLDQTT